MRWNAVENTSKSSKNWRKKPSKLSQNLCNYKSAGRWSKNLSDFKEYLYQALYQLNNFLIESFFAFHSKKCPSSFNVNTGNLLSVTSSGMEAWYSSPTLIPGSAKTNISEQFISVYDFQEKVALLPGRTLWFWFSNRGIPRHYRFLS